MTRFPDDPLLQAVEAESDLVRTRRWLAAVEAAIAEGYGLAVIGDALGGTTAANVSKRLKQSRARLDVNPIHVGEADG